MQFNIVSLQEIDSFANGYRSRLSDWRLKSSSLLWSTEFIEYPPERSHAWCMWCYGGPVQAKLSQYVPACSFQLVFAASVVFGLFCSEFFFISEFVFLPTSSTHTTGLRLDLLWTIALILLSFLFVMFTKCQFALLSTVRWPSDTKDFRFNCTTVLATWRHSSKWNTPQRLQRSLNVWR